MPAYEVSRTLVKSPPEVWSELEQAERLGELLGDDAIKITRRDPETRIEWTGAAASGTIEIGASGWGTKVRLTAKTGDAANAAEPTAKPAAPAAKTAAEPDSAAAAAKTAAEPDSAAESGLPKPSSFSETFPNPAVERKTAAESGSAAVGFAEVGSAAVGSGTAGCAAGTATNASDGVVVDEAAVDGAAGDATTDQVETEHVAEVEDAEKISLWRRIRNAFSAQPAVVAAAAGGEGDPPAFEGGEAADSADSNSANPDSDSAAEPEASASHDPESVISEPILSTVEDPPPAEQVDQAAAPRDPVGPGTDFESLLTSVLDHLGSAHKRPFSAV